MTWPKALLTMELLQTSKVKGRKGTQPILFGTATALPDAVSGEAGNCCAEHYCDAAFFRRASQHASLHSSRESARIKLSANQFSAIRAPFNSRGPRKATVRDLLIEQQPARWTGRNGFVGLLFPRSLRPRCSNMISSAIIIGRAPGKMTFAGRGSRTVVDPGSR